MSTPIETIMDQVADSRETLADSTFYWREAGGVKILVCRALEEAGFANGFSTRLGGVSSLISTEAGTDLNLAGFNEDSRENIYENRRRFLSAFSREYRLATAWQVHGDNVRFVRQHSDAGDSDERADALVSNLDDILLGVKTADCVPILLADPTTGAFAAIHAGWRGTAQRIAQKAIISMIDEFGTSAADIVCAIGPAAGCDNYEVGSDVIDDFSQSFPASDRYFRQTRGGHALVDLKAANRDLLVESALRPANISISAYCTMERADLFFSYRIEKAKYGRTGRLMSVIGRL